MNDLLSQIMRANLFVERPACSRKVFTLAPNSFFISSLMATRICFRVQESVYYCIPTGIKNAEIAPEDCGF